MTTITKNELIQKINSFYVYEKKTNSSAIKVLRPKENLLLLKKTVKKTPSIKDGIQI